MLLGNYRNGFLDFLPINELWMTTAILLFQTFCFLACIGLFTRFSSIMALILGFYVLGAPQYLGKLNHYHHLFWFLAILAMSRSGDSLSIDRLIKCWKLKSHNYFLEHTPSTIYSLPLRFIWILIGVLYFFPGFWKIWGSGLDWILSGHLKNYMYFKWMSYNYIPPFRIDQYPLLIKFSAGMVVLFELSFIFLIFSSRLRYLAVLGGFIFHKMTQIFLNIYFKSLIICYIAFIDWQKIWYWLEKNLLVKINSQIFFKDPLKHANHSKTFKPEKPYAIIFCGLFLIIGNIYYGLNNYHSWPFSCYPTFQEMSLEPYTPIITMKVFDNDRNKIEYDTKASFYSPDYFREFLVTLLHDWENKNRVEDRLKGLFNAWKGHDKKLENGVYVEFYIDTIDMRPERKSMKPVKREMLYELTL